MSLSSFVFSSGGYSRFSLIGGLLSSTMLGYMILFRSMDLQNMRDAQILERISSQATKGKGLHGDLAERRRKHMHNVLQKEQEKIRK